MVYTLPELPYLESALAPSISQETLEFHHGKHHAAYVANLNKLIAGTEFESMPLDEICAKATGPVFNNAGQHWNHSFYWQCLSPEPMQPKGELLDAIKRTFETVDHFKEKFTSSAMNNFGSGWTWLIREGDRLAIVNTSNADMPQRSGKKPVLTCDVWEHAYYIDYHNNRSAYLDAFWKLINWDFVEKQLNA